MDEWFKRPLQLGDVAHWYPGATRLEASHTKGAARVLSGDEELGTVLRSSRMGATVRGFNGPSDVIVAVDRNAEKILGISLLDSRDNEPYITDVKEELRYDRSLAGESISHFLAETPARELVVSGASITASAVRGTVAEMLRRHRIESTPAAFPWNGALTLAWIAGGVLIACTCLGKNPRTRLAFAGASVAAGLSLGWLVGQDQLIGWARHGVDLSRAWPLVVLSAVALLIPAATGKNVYCSRLCPHGAAQGLAGSSVRRRFALPAKWHRAIRNVPWLLLLGIWALALAGRDLPFADAEPFEVWSAGFRALLPAAIFTLGLLAAFAVPQAYCHYGCPTGAMLNFLTHAPATFTHRDGIAGVLVMAGLAIAALR
jgi:hypothetical protein